MGRKKNKEYHKLEDNLDNNKDSNKNIRRSAKNRHPSTWGLKKGDEMQENLLSKETEGPIKIPEKPKRGLMEQLRRLDILEKYDNRFDRVKNLYKRYTEASRWINEKIESKAIQLSDSDKIAVQTSMKEMDNPTMWGQIATDTNDDIRVESPDKSKQDAPADKNLHELIKESENVQSAIDRSLDGRKGIAFASDRKEKRNPGEDNVRHLTEKAEAVVMDILKKSDMVVYNRINPYVEGGKQDYQWLQKEATPKKYRGTSDNGLIIEIFQRKMEQRYREFGVSIMPAIKEVEAQKSTQPVNTSEGPALKILRERREKLAEYRTRLNVHGRPAWELEGRQ